MDVRRLRGELSNLARRLGRSFGQASARASQERPRADQPSQMFACLQPYCSKRSEARRNQFGNIFSFCANLESGRLADALLISRYGQSHDTDHDAEKLVLRSYFADSSVGLDKAARLLFNSGSYPHLFDKSRHLLLASSPPH